MMCGALALFSYFLAISTAILDMPMKVLWKYRCASWACASVRYPTKAILRTCPPFVFSTLMSVTSPFCPKSYCNCFSVADLDKFLMHILDMIDQVR